MPFTVAVIVPTFNRAKYLGESLDAILHQSRKADRILVVDDGSTDHTEDVLLGYAGAVTCIRQSNAGKSSAINLALRQVTEDAIWVVDDDDIVLSETLSKLEAALKIDKLAGFSYGAYDNFSIDSKEQKVYSDGYFKLPVEGDLHSSLLIENAYIFQPAMLVRREALVSVGGFDETLVRSQDYDVLLRLARSYRGSPVNEVLFHQRQHTGDRGTSTQRIDGAQVWKLQESFDARIIRKHYDSTDIIDYLPAIEKADRSSISERSIAKGLLRRATALARRKQWDLAASDLYAISCMSVDVDFIKTDAKYVGEFWYNIDWNNDCAELSLFLSQVKSFPPNKTLNTLIYILIITAFFSVKRNAKSLNLSVAISILMSSFSRIGWIATLEILTSRIQSKRVDRKRETAQ